MRQNYKVIDMDTHVGPSADVLDQYVESSSKHILVELKEYRVMGYGGQEYSYEVEPVRYRRDLGTPGEADVKTTLGLRRGRLTTHRTRDFEPEVSNMNWEGRIKDMDVEGRDIDFIFPGLWPGCMSTLEPHMWQTLYRAYHRYMDDYCNAHPDRLKPTLLVGGGDVEWSVAEIKEWAKKPWVGGVWPIMPVGKPPDHPDNDPIWAAINDADLPIIHHSVTYYPPYFPGYRDVYDSIAIARTSAHPWGGQRLIMSIIGSGLLDKYPNLRLSIGECGHGWIAPFILRFDWQSQYAGGIQDLKYKPSEYVMQGRVRPAIEIPEGEPMTKAIFDILGDDVLMFQSDYPHGETHFPNSVDIVLGWKSFSEEQMRKLLWDNAADMLRL